MLGYRTHLVHEVGPLVELLSGAKNIAINKTTGGVGIAAAAVVVEPASLLS